MAERTAKHGAVLPTLLWALLGLLIPAIGSAALPPKEEGAAPAESVPEGARAAVASPAQESVWAMPSVRIGGTVSYNVRRNITEEQNLMQKGLENTLSARTAGFIWQPWAALYSGVANVTMARDKSASDIGGDSQSASMSMTGNGQLSILPQSNYPFEAHFSRATSQYSNDLTVTHAYTSQSFGFTQHYMRQTGDTMLGWDRNTQNDGRDQQDGLRASAAYNLEQQRLQLMANLSRNAHDADGAGEKAQQRNVTVQHSFSPGETVSMESMLSNSQSGYRLRQANGATRATQLSSVAFWHPEEGEMTVTGGTRLFMLEDEAGHFADDGGVSVHNRNRNANFNLGLNYDAFRFTRISAGANLNLNDNNGVRDSNANQSLGIGYQPDPFEIASFRYNWSTSANASRSSGKDANRQIALQAGHDLSRNILLGEGAFLNLDVGQSIASVTRSSAVSAADSRSGVIGADGTSQQLTHNASLAWNQMTESFGASARLSASDARTLGTSQDFFQIINFQASSNLPATPTSSWGGNLTIQAVRQAVAADAGLGTPGLRPKGGFVGSSSGSLMYQQQRLFGIRHLRLVSDLRLNGQALLPLLGGPQSQETAGWENRFDYAIGRTQIRLNFLIARSVTPVPEIDAGGNMTMRAGSKKVTKSISFSVSRAIGDL